MGGGEGVLEFFTCFQILLLSKIDLLLILADGRGGGGVKKLVIYCWRHKWMVPNAIITTSA